MMLSLTAFPITSLMQATISKYTTKNQRDLALGLYLTVGFGVSSIWSSFIGYLIDLWRSFTPAWLIMSSLGLIALFFQLLAYKCRN
jgi:MFS family permease